MRPAIRHGALLLLALGALASVAGATPATYTPWLRLAQAHAHTGAPACGAPVQVPLVYVDYPDVPEEGKYQLIYLTTNAEGRVGMSYSGGPIQWVKMCNASPCRAYWPLQPGMHNRLTLWVQGEQGPNCYYDADVWDWSLRVGP